MIHAEAVSRAINKGNAIHSVDVVGDDGVAERMDGWLVTKTCCCSAKVVQNVRRSESGESWTFKG